ncbi:MAG: autotransporter domain-containing protein, partial [Pseudomonadota bacterium]
LDAPITDVPSMPLLLTPLDQLTHMVVAGYGTFGTGDTGTDDIGFLRRVGENMLGAIASPADLLDAVFPGAAPTAITSGAESQVFYFIDFDDPTRTQADIDGCTFGAVDFDCVNDDALKAIDWFPGDALPLEAGTAGGDSGSALIADQLSDISFVTAVLSGGFDFTGLGNQYGDVSFYNPLYPFFEFITENTPYKYVSAKRGSVQWSDPDDWTQDLDPGFYIEDEEGDFVNGVPTGSEPGVYETGPKLGTILTDDVSDNVAIVSPILPAEGTANFGADTPDSSALLGPGSTGFVPNNTDGTPGDSFTVPAQYFDVILNQRGRVNVDIDVEIDKLTVAENRLKVIVPTTQTFTAIQGLENVAGTTLISGTLNAGLVTILGGKIELRGTMNTTALFNLGGLFSAGRTNGLGTATLNGDFVQTSGGFTVANFRNLTNQIQHDTYIISGSAALAGGLAVLPMDENYRFGDSFTLISAGAIDGDFETVQLLSASPILNVSTEVIGGDFIVSIDANPISVVVGQDSAFASLGGALDTIRFDGQFNQFTHVFDVVDHAGVDTLGQTLASLAPTSAFNQTSIAMSFSNRFSGQISQRTLSLRGGDRAASGFSAAGNASFAIAGSPPQADGEVGFFGTVSGIYLDQSDSGRSQGVSSLQEGSISQAGELTLGADMRVSGGLSFGFAMTDIRNSESGTGLLRPQQDRSRAVAAFAAYQSGNAFADAYAGSARQNFGVERSSQGNFASAFGTALGANRSDQTFAGMRVGYAVEVAPGLNMGPVASVDYVHNDITGYTEYGANEFALEVAGREFTSIGTKIGAMGSLDLPLGRIGTLTAFGSAAYSRELADKEDVVTANFLGARNAPFTIANQLDTEWVSVNAGAELGLSDDLHASLSVTSDMGRGALSNTQSRVSLNWRF